MHEFSLCSALVEEVTRWIAPCAPGMRVTRVTVRVGKLRSVVEETMRFAFAVATLGTPMQGATLQLEEEPVRVACRYCRVERTLAEVDFICPRCGRPVDIIAGNDIVLVSIDVEQGGDSHD